MFGDLKNAITLTTQKVYMKQEILTEDGEMTFLGCLLRTALVFETTGDTVVVLTYGKFSMSSDL